MVVEQLIVSGMSCANCAAHVTKALESLPGTSKVSVDFHAGRAAVEIDPNAVSLEDLIAAIAEEGYTATQVDPD
jgi:copper chaperone CopZ